LAANLYARRYVVSNAVCGWKIVWIPPRFVLDVVVALILCF
jgi:hypothetical protein